MATNATLTATPRTDKGKGVARKLRASGQVPAVIYGHAREPQSLVLDARELGRLLDRISAANTVVEVTFGGRPSRTLIREIQRHPVKRHVLHVDFQELVAGEKVVVQVPLVIVGTAEGVRTGGGVLDHTMHSIEIEVDPANMHNHIDVDVSNLGIGDSVHVRDLNLPAGATVLDDPDASVLTIQITRAEVEEAATAEEATTEAAPEPEVIRAKKDDESE